MNELEKRVQELAQKDKERQQVEIVMMILSDCNEEQLKKIGEYDAFKRMAINFVKNNNDDDINLLIKHNTIFKFINHIFNK